MVAAADHILLIDVSGFAHRAFHTGSGQFRSDGLPTWAITGFLAMMWRLLGAAQADQPTHAAAVFDAPGKTFRNDLFGDYKTNRPARALELSAQLPYLRHAATAMGLAVLEKPGFEADDVIATMASRAYDSGSRATIVSSDKDFHQCVIDGHVEIVDPITRKRVKALDVLKKFGVTPPQVPDVQALAGDAIDNIPGIDGMGVKTASVLVRKFRNLEGVTEAAKRRNPFMSVAHQRAVRAAEQALPLYLALTTLRRDVPIAEEWGALAVQPIMRESVDRLLETLEATARFDAIFGTNRQMERPVDRGANAPQPGYYMTRLVKGGPWVPARIWEEPEVDIVTQELTGAMVQRCTIGTRPEDPLHAWGRLQSNPIKHARYEHMMAVAGWARQHAPAEPEANADKAINWDKVALR